MHDYRDLIALPDEDLAKLLMNPQPGSPVHEQIKFEIQRRAMAAQIRAASATERYAKLTVIFIVVTAVGSALNAFATILR